MPGAWQKFLEKIIPANKQVSDHNEEIAELNVKNHIEVFYVI